MNKKYMRHCSLLHLGNTKAIQAVCNFVSYATPLWPYRQFTLQEKNAAL